ncbi:hypothetical protein DSO57_1004577 [Entomophthora muscae]|uniref:Uncharacterized protein n=1 Tax=Entomophthora muscae TaxID=34485 RepID=A0ACC2RZD0_9FUNG|nr:hypothetical protein DSO57_1004577 [Entomophthora muscae]
MKLSLTSKPTVSTPLTPDATCQSSQFLRVLYLALTGLIDSVLPEAGPWAVAGKALSYLVKLVPIIWWAMPVPALTPPSPKGALWYSWYPDMMRQEQKLWDTTHKLCATTQSQNLPEVTPQTDSQVVVLTTQAAAVKTIFLLCTKKSAQKPAKPLNFLEDLTHTVDERFVLTYPSMMVYTDVMNSVPT